MHKTSITVALIAAAAALLGWRMFLNNGRYDIVSTQGMAYEVDHRTGTTWTLLPRLKEANQEPDAAVANRNLQPLPADEVQKLNAEAHFSAGSLYGKIYNGSGWRVKAVVFQIAAMDKDGKTRWTRRFRKYLMLLPLTTESLNMAVTADQGADSFHWQIVSAAGTPPD